MRRNLGATSLPRKRRPHDPMRSYDALPPPLRAWLAKAALPWSPASVRRLWKRAKAQGHVTHTALQILSRAEERTLACHRRALKL